MKRVVTGSLGILIAGMLVACSGQSSGLPNVSTNSPASGATVVKQPGGGVHQDDPCAGGNDTVCSTGGGGGGTGTGTGTDDVPGAGNPGGGCLVVKRGGVRPDNGCGGGGGGGGVAKGPFRNSDQYACNNRGGTFITIAASDIPPDTACSLDAPGLVATIQSLDCLAQLATSPNGPSPSSGVGVNVSAWPVPGVTKVLPGSYYNVYGVQLNTDTCTLTVFGKGTGTG